MSSTTNRPEAKPALSITARLVAFYLVSTLVTLLCTNYFQFRAISADLDYEDNDFLVERIGPLREDRALTSKTSRLPQPGAA